MDLIYAAGAAVMMLTDVGRKESEVNSGDADAAW